MEVNVAVVGSVRWQRESTILSEDLGQVMIFRRDSGEKGKRMVLGKWAVRDGRSGRLKASLMAPFTPAGDTLGSPIYVRDVKLEPGKSRDDGCLR